MNNLLLGLVLILFGLLYLIKPNIFRRWFWKRTSIAQRMLSKEAYEKYMRFLGLALIVVGIVLAIFGGFSFIS